MDFRKLQAGDDIYYVDKSEGPGVAIYIHGTVISIRSNGAVLEVADSGTLIAPGFMAPYEPSFEKGKIVELEVDRDTEFLSAAEFGRFRNEYEKGLSGHYEPLPESEVEDKKEAPGLSEEEEERPTTREEIEEGAPEFEEEGLYLTASLKSWANTVGLVWPKGFPQDWMEQVYNNLPEGTAETTPSGEPVIGYPGSKGLTPAKLPEEVKLEEAFSEASERLHNASKKHEEALKTLKETENEDNQKAFDAAVKELEAAKDHFNKVKQNYTRTLDRPPESHFERGPSTRAPYERAWGRAGLRQELKQLSTNYQKTLNLIDTVNKEEDVVDFQKKEINLLLNLRRRTLKSGGGKPPKLVPGVKYFSTTSILNKLKKLKYQELKEKEFLWTRDQIPNLIDRSGLKALYESKLGSEMSFFDIPPEELDSFIKEEVERKGPMPPEDVAKRAWKYATDYKQLLSQQMAWRSAAEDIRKYLFNKRSLIVSEERAERIEKEMKERGTRVVLAKGRDAKTGEIAEQEVPVSELFNNVINKIYQDYQNKILWLVYLQKNRESALNQKKKELRRALVQETEKGKEVEPIDDQTYKDAVISLFHKYAKVSHEEGEEKIPKKYRIEHGLPAYEEITKALNQKKAEEKSLEARIDKIREEIHEAYAPYKHASEDLELYQEDIGRVTDPEIAQSDVEDILDASKAISDKIDRLVKQKEFNQKFYRGRAGWKEKVETISKNFQKAISSLEKERANLFRSPLPEKVQKRLVEYERKFKTLSEEYQEKSQSLEENLNSLYSELDKVRNERMQLAEKIGR